MEVSTLEMWRARNGVEPRPPLPHKSEGSPDLEANLSGHAASS